MAKKRVDLKQRLDDLRHDPEPPVAVMLQLDADLYRLLIALAAGEQLSLDAYLVNTLQHHAENTLSNMDE